MRELRLKSRGLSGFTLVELMVSISVLAILGGLVAQLMSSASRLTSTSKQSSDCDTEARYALGQISADIAHRVRRPDVDALVKIVAGNSRLYLFSETAGFAPTLDASARSTVSLVGYRLKAVPRGIGSQTGMELQRYARALPWSNSATEDDKSLPFVILTGTPPTPLASSTLAGNDGKGSGGSFPSVLADEAKEDIYFQPLAQNVVRFEVTLLKKADSSNPASPVPAKILSAAEIPVELAKNGLSNIASIIVTIAVLDAQNAAKVTQADIDALNLPSAESSDTSLYPLDRWNAKFKENVASLPKPLANGLHFYQRVISL
jgi:prepilin-type N-terminal cleavage/methylation domain-containing protein